MKFKLYFRKKTQLHYATLHNLTINQFIKLLKLNSSLKEEFEKHMKNDMLREKLTPPPSIVEMWEKNKIFKKHKTHVGLLIHKKKYIGSFLYSRENVDHDRVKNISKDIDVNIKISIVYIIPSYRNVGLAGKMLQDVVANNKCYMFVDNDNTKAYNLYAKLGFEKVGWNSSETLLSNWRKSN